jgi:uncharacterized protein YndB with AHSA1/START domain
MSVDGIDTDAPVVARHGIEIAAPIDVVWRLHTDVDAWPSWQQDIEEAHINGDFLPGTVFTWLTHHLHIASTVYQVEPARRTLWGGPSEGITGIHAWTFTPVSGGVRVDTEESWRGAPVDADPAGMRANLDKSLAAWLGHLKAAAESRS